MDRPDSLLVVEDDEATASFLAENFAADGFKVATASGAGEGLRAIEVRKPTIVILDLLLEDGHGQELLERVRAVLRRTHGRPQRGVIRVGELTLDPLTRAVRLKGKPVHLAAKEFALLQALAENPTRVYGKQELLRDVWGYLSMGNTRTLDAHACRLRKKLTPSGRPWVVNVRGVGYKLTEAL